MIEEYIQRISILLAKCEDEALLDLIYKLLLVES